MTQIRLTYLDSFKDIMAKVNASEDPVSTMRYVMTQIIGIEKVLIHYFTEQKLDFSGLEVLPNRRKIPDGVKLSFQAFLKDLGVYSNPAIQVHRRNSIFSQTAEWIFEDDLLFISRLINGEEIPEFTEFGLENFLQLTHNKSCIIDQSEVK